MSDANRELLAEAHDCLEKAIAAYTFGPTSYSNEAMHHCLRLQKRIAELHRINVGDCVRRSDAYEDEELANATFTVEFVTHDGFVLARWDQKPEVRPFIWESALCEVVPPSLKRTPEAA